MPAVAWFARHRGLLVAALALNLAVSVLVALPVLPVGTLAKTPIADINQAVSDQIGWPVYVRQITDVYAALPAADRERAVIVTANYGEAGALDRYGPTSPASTVDTTSCGTAGDRRTRPPC